MACERMEASATGESTDERRDGAEVDLWMGVDGRVRGVPVTLENSSRSMQPRGWSDV